MELRAGGYNAVVTSALGAADAAPFVDAGFGVRERLYLLGHDLNDLPHCTVPTRRARRRASTRALVNTQLDDTATLALHESCGFCRLPVGLCVLGRAL